jgi:hypothetical protein
VNIKLIKYAITITVIACAMFYYFKQNSMAWRINDTATYYIQIKYDDVDEYLFEVENRLSAYPEWILAVFHGGLSQFEKEYYPYILSDKDFELLASRFKHIKIQGLLSEYSTYLENRYIIKKDYSDIDNELMRINLFTNRLISLMIDKNNTIVDEIVDPIYYGFNTNYNFNTELLEIKIVYNKDVKLNEKINDQIQRELHDVNGLFNANIVKHSKDAIETMQVSEIVDKNDFKTLYSVFPSIGKGEFNKRKKKIKNSNSEYDSFIGELSIIEEKLIELQLTIPENSILIRLIGTEEEGGGILSTFINKASAKRYNFLINQYVKDFNIFLNSNYKTRNALPYPTIQMLPVRLKDKYLTDDKYIIYKF